uniref:Tetratricopeptide repeat protein n=1 Tax=Eiseniibacteriota bacterium TaxID=2212470 RepID=A0A832I5W2_UNCEI
MRRVTAAPLVVLAALALAGCGDPGLWARWQAERAAWRAQRLADRISIRPSLASDAEWARAVAAFDAVARRWPAARWLDPGAGPRGRDVARIALRARIAAGHLEFARGRAPAALAAWTEAEREAAALPAIAVEAATARAEALAALGRTVEAAASWEEMLATYPVLDPEDGAALPGLLRAAGEAPRAWAAAGRAAARDTALATGEAALAGALAEARGEAAASVAAALARVRDARGDAAGAADARRRGLAALGSAARRSALALEGAEAWLAAGVPDSARAWAGRAAGEDAGATLAALRIEALAHEAAGAPQAALAAWSRLLAAASKAQDAAAEARFRRGDLLERLGQWERARSEFRALAAAFPTHPLAFESYVRVVRHHERAGEADLGRLEARRALETMNFLIATQHDDAVQRRARRVRGELRAAAEGARAGAAELAEVWARWPGTPEGEAAAFRAAELEAGAGGDRARARALYADLAARAADAAARARARAALARLGG